MICPHCGTENKPEDHFCEECGAQLIALETPMPDNGVMGPAVPTPGNETASPTEGLTPGTSLQYGRYRITKALGEGGMGTVLLANDTRLADKPTVVKVLGTEESSDPEKLQEDVRNFKREAETVAHLDHPLIHDVTDRFEE